MLCRVNRSCNKKWSLVQVQFRTKTDGLFLCFVSFSSRNDHQSIWDSLRQLLLCRRHSHHAQQGWLCVQWWAVICLVAPPQSSSYFLSVSLACCAPPFTSLSVVTESRLSHQFLFTGGHCNPKTNVGKCLETITCSIMLDYFDSFGLTSLAFGLVIVRIFSCTALSHKRRVSPWFLFRRRRLHFVIWIHFSSTFSFEVFSVWKLALLVCFDLLICFLFCFLSGLQTLEGIHLVPCLCPCLMSHFPLNFLNWFHVYDLGWRSWSIHLRWNVFEFHEYLSNFGILLSSWKSRRFISLTFSPVLNLSWSVARY